MCSWVVVVVLLCLTGCVEQNRIEKLGLSDTVALDSVRMENLLKQTCLRLSLSRNLDLWTISM